LVLLLALGLAAGCVSMFVPREYQPDYSVLTGWDGWQVANLDSSKYIWWRRWQRDEWTRIDKNNDGVVDFIDRPFAARRPGVICAITECFSDDDKDGWFDVHFFQSEHGTRHRTTRIHIEAARQSDEKGTKKANQEIHGTQ